MTPKSFSQELEEILEEYSSNIEIHGENYKEDCIKAILTLIKTRVPEKVFHLEAYNINSSFVLRFEGWNAYRHQLLTNLGIDE